MSTDGGRGAAAGGPSAPFAAFRAFQQAAPLAAMGSDEDMDVGGAGGRLAAFRRAVRPQLQRRGWHGGCHTLRAVCFHVAQLGLACACGWATDPSMWLQLGPWCPTTKGVDVCPVLLPHADWYASPRMTAAQLHAEVVQRCEHTALGGMVAAVRVQTAGAMPVLLWHAFQGGLSAYNLLLYEQECVELNCCALTCNSV